MRRMIAVLVVVALGGCEGGERRERYVRRPVATPTSSETLVIGLVGTLSGPDRWRGDDAFEGADLAVGVLNRGLEAGDRRFELVSLDDEGDPRRATALVELLAESPRTQGVVYAGPPEGLPPAAAALAIAGIPAILCYGDLSALGLLRDPLFQISPPYLWQARVLARYAYGDRGYRRVGVLASETLSGRAARRAWRRSAPRRGPAVSYALTATDLRPQLASLRRRRVEAVVIEGPPRVFETALEGLEALGAGFQGRDAARTGRTGGGRGRTPRRRAWHPQPLGFDLAIAPRARRSVPRGAVAADLLDRGVHLLPIPNFRAFETDFTEWWDEAPLGWERRAYDAVQMVGWASQRAEAQSDIAEALYTMPDRRFGGGRLSLGRGDPVAPSARTVGLWTVPSRAARRIDRLALPEPLPWAPLARTFTTRRGVPRIAARDWPYLFERERRGGRGRRRPPSYRAFRGGVTAGPRNPIH